MINIRNFCIISHVDHGKSTLADRFLELTGTVPKEKMRPQYLDMMDLERGRGITIKMHPVRMNYILNLKSYILNLIDTPGHVDFSYEVSRSLAAVEGAILLVDATKGIQAQTLANLELARRQDLLIIPAVNKIDSPQAKTAETKTDLAKLLNIPEKEVFEISAKYGTNVEKLLQAVIEKIPCPVAPHQNLVGGEKPLRALIFDSKYDSFKGVVAFFRVIDGKVLAGEKIYLIQAKTEGEAKEIGYFKPELTEIQELKTGEIGYIATGIKEPEKVRVGETITTHPPNFGGGVNVEPLLGYQTPKPMVFASIYPENPGDFDLLKTALAKLKLNDASLSFEPEMRHPLGRGFCCGFLGTLHAEIVSERLRREFGLNLVISTPSVVYQISNRKNREISVYSPSDWPPTSEIEGIKEPWVRLEILTPKNFLGRVPELLESLEGNQIETKYFTSDKLLLIYEVPLRKIIVGFYDNLKGQTQGFASMNYEILGYRPANLVKLEILIAGKKEEAFSKIVSEKDAFLEGKRMVEKLKEILPAQLFSVPIQATISGKIVARETIKAKRRDVIAPLYGGDYTRKRKLLEKQKKGKKELKEKGRIQIPPKVFLEMFKSK